VVCDATDPSQAEALAGRLGALDVLVNAVGGRPAAAPADLPPLAAIVAEWQDSLAQNLLSAVLTAASVHDKLSRGSSIISIGSIAAERRGGSYGAAKAALAAWNAFLSAELAAKDITCNVISAGYTEGTNFFGGQLSDTRRGALVAETHNK